MHTIIQFRQDRLNLASSTLTSTTVRAITTQTQCSSSIVTSRETNMDRAPSTGRAKQINTLDNYPDLFLHT